MATLYVVATPIGNLGDITVRAADVLRAVPIVAAEDTRVAKKLLSHLGASPKAIACNEHSDFFPVLKELAAGKDVAFVSDAGTPGISDPGNRLVAAVRESLPDVSVVPLPGASALMTAVSCCGWRTDSFVFLGFLPHKKGRLTLLKSLAGYECPVFLFESVHRIGKLLSELREHIPESAQLFVGRELTKQFETLYAGARDEVIERVMADPQKGEYVVGINLR